MRRWSYVMGVVLAGALALAPRAAHGADAPAAAGDEIVLGMSTALSGPAADLGLNMRAGVLAAIDEANRSGGVHGRKIRLISLDDGYEPAKTVPNMHKLLSDPHVVAIVGNVGTPTAIAAIPIAMEARIPFYGAYSGAGVLRKTPPERYIFNYRASYAEETGAMVDAVIDKAKIKLEEIVFFTQRDAYGDAGFAGGIAALKRHGLKDQSAVTQVRYERNTLAVEKALADLLLLKTPPRAVIMVGAYAPCAAFIRLAKQNELDALFLNVSFVGSEPLARALGKDSQGVIITQTVPHFQAGLPITKDYLQALKGSDSDPSPTFGSMEGYVSTRLFLLALGKIDGPPTRETVIQALEHLGDVDLGLGADLALDQKQHQASHTVWPTEIRDGKVVPFRWEELTPKEARHE